MTDFLTFFLLFVMLPSPGFVDKRWILLFTTLIKLRPLFLSIQFQDIRYFECRFVLRELTRLSCKPFFIFFHHSFVRNAFSCI